MRFRISLLSLLLLSFMPYSAASESNELQQPALNIGFYLNSFPDILVEDIELALRFWTEEVLKQKNVRSTTRVYENLEEMRHDFYQGKINFVVANPLVFVDEFDLTQLADGYKASTYGQISDKLVLITHKQAALDNVNELKDSQLSLLSNEPMSVVYADVLALEHFGKKAAQVFSKINYSYKSSTLIYDLFFKKTDVILVFLQNYKLAVELNPQIAQQTQIIAELGNITRGMGFFHQRVDPLFREWVISEAEKMGNSPREQQILDLLQAENLVRARLADLNTAQQLKQRYQQLLTKYQLQ